MRPASGSQNDISIDPDAALKAARRALVLLDPHLAEQLLRTAGFDGFEGSFTLGTALSAQGRVDEADEALASAARLATSDEERARAISRRGVNLSTRAGRFEEAASLLEDGMATLTDPGWRSYVAADLAYARLWFGRRDSSVVERVDGGQPPAVRANECLAGAVIAVMGGELTLADELVAEGLPLAPSILDDVPTARELLTLSRFLSLAFRGDSAGATTVAAVELGRALDGSAGALGTWFAVRSMQRLIDGDLDRAVADAREAEWRLDLVGVADRSELAQVVVRTAT